MQHFWAPFVHKLLHAHQHPQTFPPVCPRASLLQRTLPQSPACFWFLRSRNLKTSDPASHHSPARRAAPRRFDSDHEDLMPLSGCERLEVLDLERNLVSDLEDVRSSVAVFENRPGRRGCDVLRKTRSQIVKWWEVGGGWRFSRCEVGTLFRCEGAGFRCNRTITLQVRKWPLN